MKHSTLLAFVCCTALLWEGICAPKRAAAAQPPAQAALDSEVVANESNQFAMDLYRQLAGDKDHASGNLFISPISVDNAMVMLYGGAAGKTAQEMRNVLHYSLPVDRLHVAFSALNDRIETIEPKNQPAGKIAPAPLILTTADALFSQNGFPFNSAYLRLLEDSYHTVPQEVDFSQPTKAAAKINLWTALHTHLKIMGLIDPGELAPATELVLVNAIYFKGIWRTEFDKEATQDEPFHLLNDKKVSIPMMHLTDKMNCFIGKNYEIVVLPYVGNEMAMVVAVPLKVDGFAAMEKEFMTGHLAKESDTAPRLVDLSLPRFSLHDSMQLENPLAAMGMPTVFDAKHADFSGISRRHTWLGLVVHKTMIDVDEKGAEAAAATGGGLFGMNVPEPPPPQPLVIRIDHPFLFYILHRPTHTALFLGRVTDPSQ